MNGDAIRLLGRMRELRAVVEAEDKETIWADWIALGRIVLDCRAWARRESEGRTRGRFYQDRLHFALLRALDDYLPDYQRLGSGTVSYLVRCVEHLDAVNEWREKQPLDKRPSSPQRVWRQYHAATDTKMYLDAYVAQRLAAGSTPPLLLH